MVAFFVGQSRAGGGLGRAAAGNGGDDRDAPRRARGEGGGHARSGAEIVFYDRATESREAIAAALAEERGAMLVPTFDDPWIVEGQGTAGLEIAEQIAPRGSAIRRR